MTDMTLSAVDFLHLTEECIIARVNLAEIGRHGVLFVKELTADEKAAVMPRPKGKTRVYKDQSLELDWSQLSPEAAAKFLKMCLVQGKNGRDLAEFFGSNGSTAETALLTADVYEPMFDELVRQNDGKPHLAMEKIGGLPNAVVDLVVKKIRQISGMDDDRDADDDQDDQKKG